MVIHQPSQDFPKSEAVPTNSGTPTIPEPQGAPFSRLTTFEKPRPSPRLIRALNPVNRWLNLGGIPVLRSLPIVGKIPGICGLVNVPQIDFPATEQARLKHAVNSGTAAFVTPNHPEFFTDWMLDKEVLSRTAPLAACWATHVVVNGMGTMAQGFWLKNNLIAQIPGAAGQAGKDYSIDWAMRGNGVLLHPEGDVGWHGDYIAPLFTGAADMALEAAQRLAVSGTDRPVYIAPVVWKLVFTNDVMPRLHRELSYIERALGLPGGTPLTPISDRFYAAYDALLSHHETDWRVTGLRGRYFERHGPVRDELAGRLSTHLDRLAADPTRDDTIEALIRRGERWLRISEKAQPDRREIKGLSETLRKLNRMRPELYRSKHITLEQIAEGIKRIRNDYCTASKRDMINKFLPIPAGPRKAVVRVPSPIEVPVDGASSQELTDELRTRMQAKLNEINADLWENGEVIRYANPFALPS